MKEYIEREAVLDAIKSVLFDQQCDCEVMPEVFRRVQEVEADDVSPVVRCRECRHSSLPSGFTQRYGEPGTLSCHYGPCNRRNVNENDFCSYGQRKEAPNAGT